MNPSVTYTGEEVALVAGFIVVALPLLDDRDFEVADLLLERALAAMPAPLSADLASKIELIRRRGRP